jgi:hypothetical protein
MMDGGTDERMDGWLVGMPVESESGSGSSSVGSSEHEYLTNMKI